MTGAGAVGSAGAPARPPPAIVLWALGVAAVLTAAGVLALALASEGVEQPILRAALLDWVSLPYIVSGLVAWRRRPESRFGPLMIVAGFALTLTTLQWAQSALVYTVGSLFDLLPAVVSTHVFLAFPTGRLERRPERVLVAVGYVAAIGGSLTVLLLGGFDSRDLLTVVPNQALAETVQNVQLVTLAAVCLGGVVLLVTRRRERAHSPRRPLALVVDLFAVSLLAFAVLLVAGIFALPGFELLRLVTIGLWGAAPFVFLLALLDARLAQSGVAGLLVELRADPAPDLRDALARALRDPSLALAYWLPTYGRWAGEDGRPVQVPDPDPRRATTLIDREGEHVAALIYDRALEDERELVAAVAAAADFALENGRLQAELQARLKELHGSRARVLEAGQRERQRLERNLHDGAQQRLVALRLELAVLGSRLAGDPDARMRVDRMSEEVSVSLDELRDLARGLHPAVLSGHGLAVALESLTARAPVPVQLNLDLAGRMPEAVEVTAYYVVSESLANAGKHARADSVSVDVRDEDGVLVVQVTDDGIGGADTEKGTGLRGLADRVEALDGRLRVWTPRGGGTRVRAEIPCG
ncbi:MAG TPA: histidine kinase [Kineosporiaceae bacterium]|nr:histidine kinase [Kineosporiaceae bacterium]